MYQADVVLVLEVAHDLRVVDDARVLALALLELAVVGDLAHSQAHVVVGNTAVQSAQLCSCSAMYKTRI